MTSARRRGPPCAPSGSRTSSTLSPRSFATTSAQRCPNQACHLRCARRSSPPFRYGKAGKHSHGWETRTVFAKSRVTPMRAIVAEAADQLTWIEVPQIDPGSGEVLIEDSQAGINRADQLQAGDN